MIIKIQACAAAFYPSVWYILEKERAPQPRHIGGTLWGETARAISEGFDAVASLRPDIQKPAWRAMISWHPDEDPADEIMNEVAETVLDRLGVDRENFQHIMVRHSEQGHQHVHIVLNRVGYDGQVFLNQRSAEKAQAVRRDLEREYDFIPAQRGQPEPDMPENLPEFHARQRGVKLYKHQVHAAISAAIAASDGTFSSFDGVLREQQIVYPEWNFAAATGRFNGGRFSLMDPEYPGAVRAMAPSGEPAVFKGAQVGWAARTIVAGLQARLMERYGAAGVPAPGPRPSPQMPDQGEGDTGWQPRPRRRRRGGLGLLTRTPRGQIVVDWMRPPLLWGNLHFFDWYLLQLTYEQHRTQQRDRPRREGVDL